MIKSCILKILNLNQNVYCNLLEVAEKPFQALKFVLKSIKLTLRKKCPYSELFWCAFSRIRT